MNRRMMIAAAAAALAAVAGGALGAELPYRTPPAPIAEMITAPPTPGVLLSRDHARMAVVGRESLPSAASLAEPILRLGGFRIDPRSNGPAAIRMNWLTSLSFEEVGSGRQVSVRLPEGLRFTAPRWSPDGRKLAFVVQEPKGLRLWVADAETGLARPLAAPAVNGAFGVQFDWAADSGAVFYPAVPAARGAPPPARAAPVGPNVQENLGRVAQAPTFEDLLSNSHDEDLFDYYFTSQLTRASISGGAARRLGAPGVVSSLKVSPDGRYVLLERLHRPYSYALPAEFFPTEISVLDARSGAAALMLTDRPLADDLPIANDAVVRGPRDASWRADAPATLVFAEAQDGGDPNRKAAVHDRLLERVAPFAAPARVLVDLKERFRDVTWGDAQAALVTTRWWRTRHETETVVDPSGAAAPRVILERNYQDQFADPGAPLMRPGPFGAPVMALTGGRAVLVAGPGATPEGERPFLARRDLGTGAETRLWEADPLAYEVPLALVNGDREIITRRESATEPPNYWVRSVEAGVTRRQLTRFPDPEPQFAGVTKQLIAYKRSDGVPLSGTLYLPASYDRTRDGPLPMLMWAYPTEFTDPRVAGQVVDRTRNRFTRPQGISHLYLLTQGYAILDGFSAPIIGAGGAQPNDTYVEQLVADAKAAVDAVVALGVADRDRIAVGGHSYGAFMTANLLAHSDLFRAGIARSGAYNRTLTPFGFQAEERTYWQATDVYTRMSPFTFAPQIKAPILLIHGEADDNTGTFPIQSERFYAALKGAGATVRYVTLPNEPHGYRGRESTLHTLWEMSSWLDRYVRNAPPRSPPAAAPSQPSQPSPGGG